MLVPCSHCQKKTAPLLTELDFEMIAKLRAPFAPYKLDDPITNILPPSDAVWFWLGRGA